MHQSFVVIFVLPLIYVTFVACNEIDMSNDCLVHYLREQNLNDEVFNKTVVSNEPLSDACKRRIKSELDSVYIDARIKYENKKEFKNEISCFIDSIKNDVKFKHLLLKKKAIEAVKLSWKAKLNPKNWLPGKKKKALKEVEGEVKEIEFEKLFVCEYEKKFSEAFVATTEAEKAREKKIDEENCIKKHLGLANNADNHNCDEILNGRKAEIFKNIHDLYSDRKKKVKKCIDLTIQGQDYLGPVFKVYLSVVQNNSDVKAVEKAFVDEMMTMLRSAMKKCSM